MHKFLKLFEAPMSKLKLAYLQVFDEVPEVAYEAYRATKSVIHLRLRYRNRVFLVRHWIDHPKGPQQLFTVAVYNYGNILDLDEQPDAIRDGANRYLNPETGEMFGAYIHNELQAAEFAKAVIDRDDRDGDDPTPPKPTLSGPQKVPAAMV